MKYLIVNLYIMNEMNNELINSNLSVNLPSACSRCKSYPPILLCKDCFPFIYCCKECDNVIHSTEEKRRHERVLIEDLFNNQNQNSINLTNINYNNTLNSQSTIPSISQEYVNNLKKLYNDDKNEYINKNYDLEKELKITKINLQNEFNDLNNKYEELQKTKELEIEEIKKNYEHQLKTINSEKDAKINYLLQKNNELTQYNDDLMNRINFYLTELKNLNIDNKNNEKYLYDKIDMLKRDQNEIKKYFESKINYFQDNFGDDKSIFIKNCEDKLNKVRNDYLNEKKRLLDAIKEREEDLKKLYEQHKKEYDVNIKEYDKYKNRFLIREKEFQDMKTKYNDHVILIEEMKNEIEKNGKLYIEEVNKIKRLKRKAKNLLSHQNELSENINNITRLTHGNFLNKSKISRASTMKSKF